MIQQFASAICYRVSLVFRIAIGAAITSLLAFIFTNNNYAGCLPKVPVYDNDLRVICVVYRYPPFCWTVTIVAQHDPAQVQMLAESTEVPEADPWPYKIIAGSVPNSLAERAWRTTIPKGTYTASAYGLLNPWLIWPARNPILGDWGWWIDPIGFIGDASCLTACMSTSLWIIRRVVRLRAVNPARCPSCGYDWGLGQSALARCPECGKKRSNRDTLRQSSDMPPLDA